MSDWPQTLVGSGAVLVGVGVSQFVVWRTDRARARREDAARSYEQRRTVYLEFVRAARGFYDEWCPDVPVPDSPPENAVNPVVRVVDEIDLFGTVETSRLAREVVDALCAAVYARDRGVGFGAVVDAFVAQARADLQVQD